MSTLPLAREPAISSQISVFDSTSGPVSTVQLWKAREVLAVTRPADFICSAHSRSWVVITNCVLGGRSLIEKGLG